MIRRQTFEQVARFLQQSPGLRTLAVGDLRRAAGLDLIACQGNFLFDFDAQVLLVTTRRDSGNEQRQDQPQQRADAITIQRMVSLFIQAETLIIPVAKDTISVRLAAMAPDARRFGRAQSTERERAD